MTVTLSCSTIPILCTVNPRQNSLIFSVSSDGSASPVGIHSLESNVEPFLILCFPVDTCRMVIKVEICLKDNSKPYSVLSTKYKDNKKDKEGHQTCLGKIWEKSDRGKKNNNNSK